MYRMKFCSRARRGAMGAYDTTARDLTQRFEANFKQFEEYVDANVKAAGVYAA